MWSCNWLSGWFWIFPLLMLVLFLGCLLMMIRARHCGGGCCCGVDRSHTPGQEHKT